jgi:5-methylcytosine-specific restriction protein A
MVSQTNPDWTWDEQILAFDLYLFEGSIGKSHPKVHELSLLLRSLPIHPVNVRVGTFRNPNGVSRKIGDIHTHRPGYAGKQTSGSRMDREIWIRYGNRPELAHILATAIREGASTAHAPEDDEESIEDIHHEGRIVYRRHRTRERDPKLRKKKLAEVQRRYGQLVCEACNEILSNRYGPLGDEAYEVHHLVPLSAAGQRETRLDDVALLCPTCHRIAHRIDPWPDRERLRSMTAGDEGIPV